jgi:hypothetical protein
VDDGRGSHLIYELVMTDWSFGRRWLRLLDGDDEDPRRFYLASSSIRHGSSGWGGSAARVRRTWPWKAPTRTAGSSFAIASGRELGGGIALGTGRSGELGWLSVAPVANGRGRSRPLHKRMRPAR